jgi:hypothetical protein
MCPQPQATSALQEHTKKGKEETPQAYLLLHGKATLTRQTLHLSIQEELQECTGSSSCCASIGWSGSQQ